MPLLFLLFGIIGQCPLRVSIWQAKLLVALVAGKAIELERKRAKHVLVDMDWRRQQVLFDMEQQLESVT